METKICSICGKEKPLSDFHKNCGSKDGHQSRCKVCDNEAAKQWYRDHREYHIKYNREYRYRTGRRIPMTKNPGCSSYLGVHIAEDVLSKVFKDVHKMPMNNKGYDFVCNMGYKIDVKSSCRYHRKNRSDGWGFTINRNKIADYFLCIAFDNRKDLNPEYLWLLPGKEINNKKGVSIAESTIKKWKQYELNDKLNKVINCCNSLREEV